MKGEIKGIKGARRRAGGRRRRQVRKRMTTVLTSTRSHERVLTKEATWHELYFIKLNPVKSGMKWRRGRGSDSPGRLRAL